METQRKIVSCWDFPFTKIIMHTGGPRGPIAYTI